MVGPFMQGVLLMGIIYWYTKGMLSLINDYYRSEIQRKILVNEPLNESSDFIQVDKIVEQHLGKIKNDSVNKNKVKQQQQNMKEIEETFTTNVELKNPDGAISPISSAKESKIDLFERADVCRRRIHLEEFYKLVEKIINRICLIEKRL